ncbi:MAG: hypothetical protein IKC77_07130 [Lentisphaeria bacterium]|nr:hypothetical protein [Lentisphaeria bacterium]
MNKPVCLFCGSDKLKFSTRISGGYIRHYIGQFHCLKCGARSPIVNSRKMDFRAHLTQAEEMELQKQALQAFQPRKEDKQEDDLI